MEICETEPLLFRLRNQSLVHGFKLSCSTVTDRALSLQTTYKLPNSSICISISSLGNRILHVFSFRYLLRGLVVLKLLAIVTGYTDTLKLSYI